ncbi:MAG: cytochrome c [Deltaproteobacteria bacterium]
MKCLLKNAVIFTSTFALMFLIWNPILASEKKKDKVDVGKTIYEEHCRVCHGEMGNGMTIVARVLAPPPKNFTNPNVIVNLKRPQMIYSVTNGRPGTAMRPWVTNLTSKEIEAVVDYIRETFMRMGNVPGSSDKLINPGYPSIPAGP